MIQTMPIGPGPTQVLLAPCRVREKTHGNAEIAEVVANKLLIWNLEILGTIYCCQAYMLGKNNGRRQKELGR